MTTALLLHENPSSGLVILDAAPELPDTVFTGVSTWLSMRRSPLPWEPSVHGNYLIASTYSARLRSTFHSSRGIEQRNHPWKPTLREHAGLLKNNRGATCTRSATNSCLRLPDLCPCENLVSCTCRLFALPSNHLRQTGGL
jgi:hypothetical protein